MASIRGASDLAFWQPHWPLMRGETCAAVEMNMKQKRTIGILMSLGALVVTACSSDNDPTAKSITVNGTGGSSSAPSTGGTAAVLPDAGNADAGNDSSVPVDAPSIEGVYTDGYFEQRITADTWYVDVSVFRIKLVNNTEKFVIALNDSKNAYNPNLWSRFDWATNSNNVLIYCQTAYDAATEQEALNTTPANAQDLAKGCDGFPWSPLTPIENTDAGADAGP